MMADVIEEVLHSRGLVCCRIDGRVTGKDRQRIIDSFNAPVSQEEQQLDLQLQRQAEQQLKEEEEKEEENAEECAGGSSSSSDSDRGCSPCCSLLSRHRPKSSRTPYDAIRSDHSSSSASSQSVAVRRPHIAVLTTKACGTGITLTGADRCVCVCVCVCVCMYTFLCLSLCSLLL